MTTVHGVDPRTDSRWLALAAGSGGSLFTSPPWLTAVAESYGLVPSGRIAVDEPWRPLTAREFDVARLISEGLTNAEIAEELGIAPKTASSHVEHILAKLGASRRAEIATWAASVDRSAVRH